MEKSKNGKADAMESMNVRLKVISHCSIQTFPKIMPG